MTEIDEIIPLIEYDIEEGNHISWYHAKILLEHINSLITTIESQAKHISTFDNIRKLAESKIQSQKEEIEILDADVVEMSNRLIDQNNRTVDLQQQFNRQKAITELAVKGLAMELNVAIGIQNKHAMSRLDKLLSEISRLSK